MELLGGLGVCLDRHSFDRNVAMKKEGGGMEDGDVENKRGSCFGPLMKNSSSTLLGNPVVGKL